MKVAYLGPHGTFSEEAAHNYYKDKSIEWHMCSSVPEVLEAVGEGLVDEGIAPIENAIEGTITMTVDSLLVNDLYIKGEAILPVSLHLLAAHEASMKEIKEVWSIPPALAQCRAFFRGKKLTMRHFDSTAGAAAAIKEAGRGDVAAVASSYAGKLFELSTVQANIEDSSENQTRFIVVSKDKTPSLGAKKTMLQVTPGDEYTGVLASILTVFSTLGINLTWIESRPTKKKLGTYQFFLEAEASVADPVLEKVRAVIETFGHHVNILGSYTTTKL
ncbi:prephenate dehydratase [Fictibacillus macauensis ZFHKF-1]|uniref:Prephenate dehydratase n=1 Tax=Fictibacillus macauensis ZFHKF-1 TaxID=1196324 RepID=I8AH30_9BACL|nr:prephenate dehydratase [Fictibacillus macauensis]EIT84734.1 prephenate dehydratase [Fictibacillus macauensis ZFHKF-1]